jgi:hypothetical protein
MKIGIITFHCADNYGAVLQAFALYQKLAELFDASDIYIVDYQPKSIIKVYSLLNIKNMRGLISSILQLPFLLQRKYNFNKFRDLYFKLLSLKDIDCLDYLVCGSDQIWNAEITNGLDPHYFGMIEGFKGKVIAYGASDGGNLTNNIDIFQSFLERFEFVSVREKSMMAPLEKYGKNITVVLDPVFLPDIIFWQKIAAGQKHRNYILIYQLTQNDRLLENAYQLASHTGKQLIEITYGFPYKRILKTKHKVLASVSLADFLSLFIHADYIFTNSFHGTAFSIIFNKNFYTYFLPGNDKRNNRIEDLLSDSNLRNRGFSHIDFNGPEVIDFSSVNSLLNKKKNEAIKFLKLAFSDKKSVSKNSGLVFMGTGQENGN